MICQTEGCEAPVVRKSNRGRPPKFCDPCKKGYAADKRSRNGTSHQPPPQPHMLAEEFKVEWHERVGRELDGDHKLADLTEEQALWLMAGPDDGRGSLSANGDTFEFISFGHDGERIRAGSTIGRATLRKPVLDLEKEAARGPRNLEVTGDVAAGSDDYYERKRRLGMIGDERHTK
jgi:hypothetical protein